MAATDGLLFIDTNQYLYFYKVIKGKKLLELLMEQREHIFVTQQIVEEVQRNKLQNAKTFLDEHFKMLDVNKFNVPDHLFDLPEKTASELQKMLDPIVPQIKQIKELLKKATLETLDRISHSEDWVTKSLDEIFRHAVKETTDELERARARKERGIPPGNPDDPLGDQVNWEQLLNQCKPKKMIWIISNDSDYCMKHDGTMFLNPVLRHDLVEIAGTELKVYCFDNLNEGIQDFVSKMGVTTEKLPNKEESKAIQEELHSLGFLTGTNSHMGFYGNYPSISRNVAAYYATLGQEDTPLPLKTNTP